MLPRFVDRQLFKAIGNQNEDLVAAYLEQKADPNGIDEFGRSPIMFAAVVGATTIINQLNQAKGDVNYCNLALSNALIQASQHKRIASALTLLDLHAKANCRDSFGNFPLLYAVRFQSESLEVALIASGHDIDMTDAHGRTALYHAVDLGDYFTVKRLLAMGADPFIADNNGELPFDVACDPEIDGLLRDAMYEALEHDLSHSVEHHHGPACV